MKTLLDQIKTLKKGAYTYAEYKSEPKPLAAHKDAKIVKVSKGVYRFGIAYKNIKEVKESGKEVGPLPFGSWEENFENYIVSHTKDEKTTKYLRFYITKHHKTRTQWYLNGEKVSVDKLINGGYISEKAANKKHDLLFIVPLQNVLKLGV